MKLVTVFTSFIPADAELARARLEASDFHVLIENEISAITPALFSAAGTIRVQVPEEEAEDARALLAAGDAPAE